MPAFHDVRFPTAISFGSSGGPERRTDIVTLASGHEERNTPWAHARRRYDAGLGIRALDDIHTVLAFFEARLGRLHAFRWKDFSDWKSATPSASVAPTDSVIGTGDGVETVFQLVKTYTSGPQTYARPITKPVAGTVRVAIDGVEQTVGTEVTVDAATGTLTFAAPPPLNAGITAGFDFDVPVRFDTDRLEISLAGFEAGEVPSIPIVEVRP